jgi:two-component system, cell cycle response regulator
MASPVTILIVDDDKVTRRILAALLTAEGYQVAQAGNGPEGLAKAASLMPDAVLLDIVMPEMDGYEVCRRLRADPNLSTMPILMLTALDDRASRLIGIQAGADDFLSKPFDDLELAARLQTITRINRYRRLVAERSRFEWIVERSQDGYLVLDEACAISYANPKARQILGLPQTMGRLTDPVADRPDFLEIVRHKYRCEPAQAWQSWPAPPEKPAARYLVRPQCGRQPACWLLVEAIDSVLGATTERVSCLRDVTAQINVQNSMNTFHNLVSHKLRTPLVPVIGGLELLQDHVAALGDPQVDELTTMILRSVCRLDRTISEILAFTDQTMVNEGGEGSTMATVAGLVGQLIAELELTGAVTSIPDELGELPLALSEQAVYLILRELLTNAQKFHPQGKPHVEVVAGLVEDRRDAGLGKIHLEVRDDGLTLTPEQLAQAWEPYYQSDAWFTGQMEGMGLGLAQVARLVWSAGGTCGLRNRASGPGVVVELKLPIADCR